DVCSSDLAIAFVQSSALRSKETPTTFSPFSWYSLYSFTKFGFSTLQGLHHAAQKSRIVTFPKEDFKDMISPSGVGAEKSGATEPTDSFFTPSNCFANSLPISLFFNSSESPSKSSAALSEFGLLAICCKTISEI